MIGAKHYKEDLAQMQSLPLDAKIRMTRQRIEQWYKSWVRFNIVNRETGETRFETLDCSDYYSYTEPTLADNEFIDSVYDGQVYISFSGGKDSTVLLHLVRDLFPDVEAVFVNTGLEYPEIQAFVKKFDNVTILRPQMRFDEVLKKYGYPIIGKDVAKSVAESRTAIAKGKTDVRVLKKFNGELKDAKGEKSRFNMEKYKPLLDVDFKITDRCCNVFKKNPAKKFEKETGKRAFLGTLAEESNLRRQQWLKYGCNGFEAKRPMSNPMAFWTEQDVLTYIKKYNIEIAPVYGQVVYKDDPEQTRMEIGDQYEKLKLTGLNRTGCIFCGYGCQLEKCGEGRFELLKQTHPRQYDYCLNGGEYDADGNWIPNKEGLGMKHVFDKLNEIYGDGFIKY